MLTLFGCLVEFTREAILSLNFIWGQKFGYSFNLLISNQPIQIFYFFMIAMDDSMFLRTYPFFLGHLIHWHIIFKGRILRSFVFLIAVITFFYFYFYLFEL